MADHNSRKQAALAILATLPLALLAQPAAAQGNLSASAYKTAIDFAGCVVDADASGAAALLATAPGSPQADTATSLLLANATCTVQPAAKAVRGAVAERLYLKRYPAAPAELAGPPPPFTGSGDIDLVYYDITRCAATRDPVGADMLVRSEPRSEDEKAALRRIVPIVGACTPAGGKIGFDREKMRGLIAEGLLAMRKGRGSN